MGTVKRKVDKPDRRNSVKRGKSFSLHYPNKYSTFDGRTPRGSKPSLAGLTLKSNSNLSGRSTPRATFPAGSPSSTRSPVILTPPASIGDTENQSVTTDNSTPRSVSPTPTDTAPVNSFEAPYQSNNVKSEYANISGHPPKRSHSFSSSHKHESNAQVFDRTTSETAGMQAPLVATGGVDTTDFASKLAHIQTQLKQKLQSPTKGEAEGQYVAFVVCFYPYMLLAA